VVHSIILAHLAGDMDQTLTNPLATSGGSNPFDQTGLCLLSLGGGGIRGLSSLYIPRCIMQSPNADLKDDGLDPVKPCEIFDLVGGTSTGG
jgi:hypothetical protein